MAIDVGPNRMQRPGMMPSRPPMGPPNPNPMGPPRPMGQMGGNQPIPLNPNLKPPMSGLMMPPTGSQPLGQMNPPPQNLPMSPMGPIPTGNPSPMGGGFLPPGGMPPPMTGGIDTAPTNYMNPPNAAIPGMGPQTGGMGGLRQAYGGNPPPQPFGMGNRRF